MLISKIAKVKWGGRTKLYYTSKGYEFTKMSNEFEVKVEDLTDGCPALVNVKCDCKDCEQPLLNPMKYSNYKHNVQDDGKYFCRLCAYKLYGNENRRLTRLKHSKSFEQWCIENSRQDILDRWDYSKNEDVKPININYSTKKKYYFKCPKGIHKSELKSIQDFSRGDKSAMDCIGCDSFAQWGIDNLGEDFLEKYWSDKNTVNPWEIKYASKYKVYLKCQEKDYHEDYIIKVGNFSVGGNRCSYCSNRPGKLHPLDSLGKILENKGLLDLWSDKNKKSPYEYPPMSNEKVWFKCPDGKHEDYLRKINNSNTYDFRCPSCAIYKGEIKISDYLTSNAIYYITQKKFDNLVGLKGGLLSYDFYLPQYNLLIEYQGEFHDGKGGNGNYYMTQNLEKQKEHDKRKKEYAQLNSINLLEIWYWDFDNIESILDEQINSNAIKEVI